LRFAFYGRTSTGRFQDPASSREWQRENAMRVIDGRGRIVAEYFDVGCSRTLAWHYRPQAAALLDAADPGRGFDAVVIGEFTDPGAGASGRRCGGGFLAILSHDAKSRASTRPARCHGTFTACKNRCQDSSS
jgi:hypothetical protein